MNREILIKTLIAFINCGKFKGMKRTLTCNDIDIEWAAPYTALIILIDTFSELKDKEKAAFTKAFESCCEEWTGDNDILEAMKEASKKLDIPLPENFPKAE